MSDKTAETQRARIGDLKTPQSTMVSIVGEYNSARRRFPVFNSPHEGYAVLLEEVEELWEEIKSKEGSAFTRRQEAIQVGAMALAFILECT